MDSIRSTVKTFFADHLLLRSVRSTASTHRRPFHLPSNPPRHQTTLQDSGYARSVLIDLSLFCLRDMFVCPPCFVPFDFAAVRGLLPPIIVSSCACVLMFPLRSLYR